MELTQRATSGAPRLLVTASVLLPWYPVIVGALSRQGHLEELDTRFLIILFLSDDITKCALDPYRLVWTIGATGALMPDVIKATASNPCFQFARPHACAGRCIARFRFY